MSIAIPATISLVSKYAPYILGAGAGMMISSMIPKQTNVALPGGSITTTQPTQTTDPISTLMSSITGMIPMFLMMMLLPRMLSSFNAKED